MLACPDLTSSLYHSRRTLSLPFCPRSLISALSRPRVPVPARRILCLRSLYKSPVTARPEFSHSVYISLCPVSIPLCTLLSLLSFPMHHLSRCALSLAAPGTSVSAHGPLHMLNLVAPGLSGKFALRLSLHAPPPPPHSERTWALAHVAPGLFGKFALRLTLEERTWVLASPCTCVPPRNFR